MEKKNEKSKEEIEKGDYPIKSKEYNMAKKQNVKLQFLIGINIFCLLVMIVCGIMLLGPELFWKELDFEYVGELNFEYNRNYSGECKLPAVFNSIPCIEQRDINMMEGPNFWLYEICNEEEWKYFCELMGIEEQMNTLEFPNYYVVSVSRSILSLYCNDKYWNPKEFGSLVRADFNLDEFEESRLYIYRLEDDVLFYYNDRDWDMGNYNMDKHELWNEEIPDKPYLISPFVSE